VESRFQAVLALALLLASPLLCLGQLSTGILRGLVTDGQDKPLARIPITIAGKLGLLVTIRSDATGKFELVLPYGEYRLSTEALPRNDRGSAAVHVSPFQTTRVKLVMRKAGESKSAQEATSPEARVSDHQPWSAAIQDQNYAGSYSLPGLLLALEPGTVIDPLDGSGLSSMRLPLLAQRAFSWTDVRYTLQGLNATDPYQPGRAVVFPDMQAVSDVVLRDGLEVGTSPTYGSEIGLFLREPDHQWHGELSSGDTGASLASGNLPPLATRGNLQQSEHFQWFTRDNLQLGGALGRRADLFLSGTGQWASQTVPQARPGEDLNSRLLFGNARGRVQMGNRDQIEGQFSGSRINLSDWGVPAGLEALVGLRIGSSLMAPWGFAGLREVDHLDFLQVGWTRQMLGPERAGVLQVRYGFSPAHLDTSPSSASGIQSRMDLVGGFVSGAPPLANLAVRTRQNLQAAFEPGELAIVGRRHRIVMGGGWELANVRNRFSAPAGLELITASGTPAFVVELNTPLDSRERIQNSSAYVRDKIIAASWVTFDLAVVADFSRGSLPSQSSPAGNFEPERKLAGQPDLIAWNSASPRAGLAVAPPMFRRMILRGNYSRLYDPLAGRYLDFGNANSVGGTEYQWLDKNGDGIYQPGETGQLLRKVGGPYSAIGSRLKRPYADEFNIGAEIALPLRSFAALRLFRRDEKDRIAATNIGVPPEAYHPIEILDPGPDSLPGTFDDQVLTVYAQDPSTFGKDRYLLTNPRGLRVLNEGVVAETGGQWRSVGMHASFMAVKSYGPTNPGNSVLENDPGVVGALLQDPNTAIHAAGRSYFDRAYAGKVQLTGRFPKALGGVEWTNTVDYLDGLVFGRRLLVTGLPQGPFIVATTVRGSPDGGNRAEYVLNWNLRLSRSLPVPYGSMRLALDILNVMNASNRVQENDAGGPLFNQRLPVAIETPRFVRVNVTYEF
jgi:hypothetical protein